jgi:hypothetical protein
MSERHWTVTKDGLERDYYVIDASRLGERWQGPQHRDGDLLDWPLHIAGKGWRDYDDFARLFREACTVHAAEISRPFDNATLERSLAIGLAINAYGAKHSAAVDQIKRERGIGSLMRAPELFALSDEATRRVGPPPAEIAELGL